MVLLFGVTIPKPVNTHTPAVLGVQFETHFMQVEPGIELEAWYIPHSQASGIILLCHGYSASRSDVLSEALAFHEMGYTTVLIDFRGSGGSSGHTTSIGFHEADDVACAVDYIQRTFQDVPLILYGQSMGSVAILRAISTHAIQPEALILEAVFDRMLSTVKNRFSAMGWPSFPGAYLLVFWGGFQQGFWGFALGGLLMISPPGGIPIMKMWPIYMYGNCIKKSLTYQKQIRIVDVSRVSEVAGRMETFNPTGGTAR